MRTPNWSPPGHWKKITTIDAHTAGEPFRVVTSGVPAVIGQTMLEKRRWAKDNLDDLRRTLMWEPRGHADMYGCLVTDPVSDEADFGVLFMHNEGWSTMCGHGIIAMAMIAVETGMVQKRPPGETNSDGSATEESIGRDRLKKWPNIACSVSSTTRPDSPGTELEKFGHNGSIGRSTLLGETEVTIDTPAGLVRAVVMFTEGAQLRVRFRNVPSFVDSLDENIAVPDLGAIRYDLAFGGAYYAFVDASEVGATCNPDQAPRLIEAGQAIKKAIMQSRTIDHPTDADLGFLYGVIFTGAPEDLRNHSRNVCVFAEGEVDRSPTGTGVSARLALHRARGEIEIGETIRIESIIGSAFECRVVKECSIGDLAAVITEVEGDAFVTGRHEFLLDPADTIGKGFLVR